MADRRHAKLLHVESLVYGVPLAVSRQRLDTVLAVLARRATESESALDADAGTDPPDGPEVTITAEGIGVLPVMGTFVKRAGMMGALSGLTSYAAVGKSFGSLVDNPQVRAILLQVDSPGGQVAGMFELAAQLYAARSKKPIWAVVDESAFSSGYLVTSAASRVLGPATAWFGSIGIVAVRQDQTAADQQAGKVPIFLVSGGQKLDGNAQVKPTDAELSRLQAKVDQMGQLFFEAVATYRGMSAEAVAGFEAGTFIGAEAVRVGLADGIATYDEALAALTAEVTHPKPTAAAVSAAARPQRRPPMAEGKDNVTPISDHPEFATTTAAIRAEMETAAAARADEISTLCILAGQPEKIGEFLTAKTPIPEVRAWAKSERAKSQAAPAVSGLLPAGKGRGTFALTSAELFAKRAQELEAARAAHPLIKRIHAIA